MKTIKYTLAASVILLSACSNYLSQKPTVSDSEQYLMISGGNIITMQGGMQGANNPDQHIFGEEYALLVKGNKIIEIGKRAEVVKKIPDDTKIDYLDLNRQTLLPGFIEPHAHLQLTVAGAQFTDLMPCLPDKYQEIYEKGYGLIYKKNDSDVGCLLYVEDAINRLANSKPIEVKGKSSTTAEKWYIGNGMDPSRMLLNEDSLTKEKPLNDNQKFLAYPARYLEKKNNFKKSPVFILDQSGHLGYVNQQAFKSAGICDKKFDISDALEAEYQSNADLKAFIESHKNDEVKCSGTKLEMEASQKMAQLQYGFLDGNWGIVEIGDNRWGFSGLLQEESSYYPLLSPLEEIVETFGATVSLEDKMRHVLNIASQQGVTTFAEGGGSSQAMINSYKKMSTNKEHRMPARIRALYTWDGDWCVNSTERECQPEKIPFDSNTYKGIFSAAGIKLWADGSTQGCSGDLSEKYSEDGMCKEFGKGHQNYKEADIVNNLQNYAKNDWYIHIHANGDQAIRNSIEAFKTLAKKSKNYKKLPSVLIHSTVNGTESEPLAISELIVETRRAEQNSVPNLSSSHLIGHVAYWGASFVNELGESRANYADPTKTEWDKSIPLSLHSDMSITPLYPLWFVEQAVTRNTWTYPNLVGEGKPLNKDEALTPYQALMAITINPAMQHNIHTELGSLEIDKIADMVVLAKNPLDIKSTDIHSISVSCTFLNGEMVQWFKASNSKEVLDSSNCKLYESIDKNLIVDLH